MSDEREYKTPLHDFMADIGELTIEWNHMHQLLLRIFQFAMPCPAQISEAIFFSQRSDSAQRALVKAALETVPVISEGKHWVLPIIQQIEEESGLRNAAIHSMWTYDRDETVSIHQDNKLARKGKGDAIKKELRELTYRCQQKSESLAEFPIYMDKLVDVRLNPHFERQKPIKEAT